MMKKNILFIVIMWSLLTFVSYNVLTVAATTEKEYTWTGPDGHKDKVTLQDFELEDIPDTCDASEDYNRNEKLCNVLYEWEEEVKERTAKEDAICDNEDADTTDIELCMSDKLQSDKINEKICNKVDGKWTKDGCETDHDGPKADRFHELQDETPGAIVYDQSNNEEQVIEDWGNTVTTEEEALKQLQEPREADENPVHGNAEMEYNEEPDTSSEEDEEEEEEESNEDNSEDDSNEEDSE